MVFSDAINNDEHYLSIVILLHSNPATMENSLVAFP